MEKKIDKIVGLKKSEFDTAVNNKDLFLCEARLIPTYKIGDEMALSSVILSAIRLIKEFGKMVLSDAKMPSSGKIHAYTEISFAEIEKSRIDGLLLIEKGGVIRDAAIFEMKNGNAELDKAQIEKYLKIAQKYNIPRLITISNQFVSEPSQFLVNIKPPKNISLFHFSWSYLLTIAHILLFDNDTNIGDQDQVEIMKEVVSYIEYEKSGVSGFTQMKAGWKEIVDKINAGASIKLSDPDLEDTVVSWQQEEKDMALILSKNLGIFVSSGIHKYKNDLQGRIQNDKKNLLCNKRLESSLKVKGAVSDIKISTRFEKRIVEMSVELKAPQDKKIKGQLNWINKQLDNCFKKSKLILDKISAEIFIEVSLKNISKPERVTFSTLDSLYEEIREKDIKEFKIIYVKDFGKQFASRRNFVSISELMLLDFYSGIVQNLSKYEQPAPKIAEKKENTGNEIVEKIPDTLLNESILN